MAEDVVVEPLRHGYTTADLAELTRRAALLSRWKGILTYKERADIAQFAVVERILSAAERPDFWFLVNAGEKAINRYVKAEGRYRGFDLGNGGDYGGKVKVKFFRYWHGSDRLDSFSHEDRVVDALALRQIWPMLTEAQQMALLAFAKYGDHSKAGAELSTSPENMRTRVHTARKRFLQWWHQNEKPSRVWAATRPRNPKAKRQLNQVMEMMRQRKRRQAAKAANRVSQSANPAGSP